jgi:hypothetical protein
MTTNILALLQVPSSDVNMRVVPGIDAKHIDALITYANQDPQIQSQTTDLVKEDGSPGRFQSRSTYDNWSKQDRTIYTLVDDSNALCGIAWFSHEPKYIGDRRYDYTFALRLYASARGVGLAKPFAKVAHTHFLQGSKYQQSEHGGIWLSTGRDNIAAIKTYASLGYQQVDNESSHHKITMVLQ